MSYLDKYKAKRKGLIKRHEEAYQRKDKSSQYGSIFKNIPEDLTFWKVGEGRHEIDVIPFFAGPNVPFVKEDDLEYKLDIWVHQNVGATNDPFVCPARNFKKPCPMCEYIEDQKRQGIRLSKKEYGQVSPKRRCIYFVWVHDDDKEEEKGVQLWEVAHFFFEMNVAEISLESPENGGMNVWTDVEDGSSVMFTRKGTGRDNTQYFGHKFVTRRKPITEDILEKIFPLDEIIEMHPSYDDIKTAFYGGATESEAPAAEEESPGVTEEAPSDEMRCPEGAKFGEDFNKYEQCDECPVYDDCGYDYDKKWKKEPTPKPTPKAAPTPRATPIPRRERR